MKIQAETYMLLTGMEKLPGKYDLEGWQKLPTSEKQKALMDTCGIGYSRVKYRGQASIVIDTYMIRKAAGMASPKQLALLMAKGFTAKELCKLTVKQASFRIHNLYKE